MPMNPRHAKLLEELPKHAYKVKPSAIKAGYSPIYADKQAKQILRTALKAQGNALIETATNKPTTMNTKEVKKKLSEAIGLSSEEVANALKKIALNDRDFNSALKVLAVIAKSDLDFNLSPDEGQKTIVPILNIGVRETIDGSIEPPNDPLIE